MPQPPDDPQLTIFTVGMMLLSITACMNLFHMRRNGPLLPREPRRPVPWGAVGAILAAMYLLVTISTATSDHGGDAATPMEPSLLLAAMVQQCLIVGGFLFFIALFTKSTSRDLGLPASLVQLARDALIGAAASLAVLAPVHILQLALMYMFMPKDMESGHPLVKMVQGGQPNPTVFLLAGAAALIAAPICEEIAFRLLLQGWLEKWEDRRLGWRAVPTEATIANDETQPAGEEQSQLTLPPIETSEAPLDLEPPRQGVLGLPYGVFPILVSAALFGIAHFGYGPEPVPLFALGLVLGYLYQRTHRIVPCIVAHALFNLFTLVVLWRMVYHHG